jgi:hypothetical protein
VLVHQHLQEFNLNDKDIGDFWDIIEQIQQQIDAGAFEDVLSMVSVCV